MLKEYSKQVVRTDLYILISLLSLVIYIFSCERLEIKRITKVSTGSVSGITASSSIVQGNVIEQEEAGIAQHGHCWSVTTNPSISNKKTELGPKNTTGVFNSTLTELSPGTQYFVRAYTTDKEGTTYGNEVSFVTLAIPIPAVPTNLIAQVISNSQINLSWTDNSDNEEGFKIEILPDGGTNWNEIDTAGADVTNFQSKGLSPSTSYSYRVRAYNAGGISDYSNTANATTQSDVSVLNAPTNLIANAVSSSQIDLNWTDNSDNEEGFKIESSPDGSTSWMEIATAGAGITTFQNADLFPTTQYYYRVRAYNTGGNSDYSNTANATTQSDVSVLNAPTNLIANAVSSSQIDLNWTDNSDNEEGFKIESSPDGSSGWMEIATVGAGITTFQNADLFPTTQYYYRVRAYNADGNSNYSNTANAITLSEISIPSAPTNLSADANTSSQIDLNWTDNSDNEEGFKIESSPDGSTSWMEIATVDANLTNFSNMGLSPSTQYCYRVRAFNTGGNSEFSNTACNTTQSDIPIPPAPGNLIAEAISDSRIDLNWADNSDNEEGFKIERSAEGINWTEIATVGAGITTFQNIDLTHSTLFYYRVKAFNYGGNSEPSNTAYAETSLCPGYLLIDHIAGDIVPVTETGIRYGVVETNLSGENKCWIKQNLGAHHVAGGPTDNTEDVAGWYWQFNRKQGYNHDGITRTPGSTWIVSIDEGSDWTVANDPCTILFGRGWRIPTQMEWQNADFNGNWNNYNDAYTSDLKLHAAGALEFNTGSLYARGASGLYGSSVQENNTRSWFFLFDSGQSMMEVTYKSLGFSIRCIRD